MKEKKELILKKIDELISKRKAELFRELPSIHEIEDGIIIRFFTDWDSCEDNEKIKFKKIPNVNDATESTIIFYLPKDAYFNIEKHKNIKCVTCLSGNVEIYVETKITILNEFSKMCLDVNEFAGRALENTYIITTSKK